MNCRKVSHLLSAYIDSELPGVEYRQIREHLGQCSECAEEYEGLLATKRMLARLRVQPPQQDLPSRIFQTVDAHVAAHVARPWFQRLSVGVKWPATLGVAFGATAAAAFALFFAVRPVDAPASAIQWMPVTARDVTPLSPSPASAIEKLADRTRSLPAMPILEPSHRYVVGGAIADYRQVGNAGSTQFPQTQWMYPLFNGGR